MTTVVTWHGDQQESLELISIVRRECTCRTPTGQPQACVAHEMLLNQRVVDGLLFARRIAERLLLEEFAAPRLPTR